MAYRLLLSLIGFLCVVAVNTDTVAADVATKRPHFLFIAIDDQNDWVGALGGHPLARTPHLDQLAQQGTVFLNAHCQAPLCNPSRTSLMLGLRPTTTGVYGLAPWFRTLPEWKARVTLPQHFKANGYTTYTTGKIFHGGPRGLAAQQAEFDVWGPEVRLVRVPRTNSSRPHPRGTIH